MQFKARYHYYLTANLINSIKVSGRVIVFINIQTPWAVDATITQQAEYTGTKSLHKSVLSPHAILLMTPVNEITAGWWTQSSQSSA